MFRLLLESKSKYIVLKEIKYKKEEKEIYKID